MMIPTRYKNFSWTPTAQGNEEVTAEQQYARFCNDLVEKGWQVMGSTPVGKGMVAHCKSIDPEGVLMPLED